MEFHILSVLFILITTAAQIPLSLQDKILDGVNNEDTTHQHEDGWSKWSEWSKCTQDCGGGVAIQSRRCLHIQGCRGSSVRYNVCNDAPCPEGVPDMLAQQCAKYNTVHYNGELHDWEPASMGDRSCALTCRAKGMNGPPITLNARVLDGTRCGNDSEGMCVHGQCQLIGCDMVLGSLKVVDACGVCGGDGSSCRNAHWVKVGLGPCSATCGGGYRVVTVVCKDATSNVEVPEEKCLHTQKPSQVIVTCGEKVCPASWLEGEWQECSATCGFGYKLREVSCMEQRNSSAIRVADHECKDPRPPHRRTCGGEECPRWFEGIWSECSVTCGEGVQRRAVQCRLSDGKSSDSCQMNHRPDSTRPCRTGVRCPPSAVLAHPRHMPYTDSLEPEEDETANFLPSEEPLSHEENVPAEPTFIAGSWSSCSMSCGEGIRTREVTCKIFLEFSRTVAVLPDSHCSGDRPSEVKMCFSDPCDPIMMSESSQNPSEELSKQFTSLESMEPSSLARDEEKEPFAHPLQGEIPAKLQSLEDDESAPNDYEVFRFPSPDSEEIPPRIVPLEDKIKNSVSPDHKDNTYDIFPYKKRYVWKQAGFTTCSASCLGGVQESVSHCVRAEDQKRVASSLCDLKSRPDSITKTCNDQPCPPQWEESPFEPCSKSCGGGITRRQVRCVQQVTMSSASKISVSNSQCPQPPPYAQKFCNLMQCPAAWDSGKWSQCSTSCGRGVKTREVQCMQTSTFGKKTTLPSYKCAIDERPSSERGCSNFNCGEGATSNKKRRKGPAIKTVPYQNYFQKKYMKTVSLKIGGRATVFHGAKIRIKCPVRRFDSSFLTWWKNGEPLGTLSRRTRRFRVTDKGILKINRVQYTDAGVYICKAEDQEANLTLRVEPLPASFVSSDELSPDKEEKLIKNEVYTDVEKKEKENEKDLILPDSSFAKAGFKLASETEKKKELTNNLAFGVKDTSGPFKSSGRNIHTVEESSIENPIRAKLSNRPVIYGTLSHHGTRVKAQAPYRGISLLSTKVAQSKRQETTKDDEIVDEYSSLPAHRKNESDPEPLQHVFGTLFNVTKTKPRLTSEERMYFGTLHHQLQSNHSRPMSLLRVDPSKQEKTWKNNDNKRRDHKERSTELTFNENISGNMLDLFSDAAADGGFSAPQFLGKGSKDSLQFEWKVTNWTECSQTCSFSGSSGGYQVRSTQCVVRVNNVTQAVDGALCEDAGLSAPPTIQQCGADPCPQWGVSDWSDCENSRCFTHHYAFQKREVTCVLHNGTGVPSNFCDSVTKPRHRRECYNRQCIGVWRTGEWSKCTAPCEGQGYRTRLLQCVWNGTKKSAGNACSEEPRPEVVRWCDGPPCPTENTEKPVPSSQCQDMSRYCKIVQRINMCRVKLYRQKCCRSCQ